MASEKRISTRFHDDRRLSAIRLPDSHRVQLFDEESEHVVAGDLDLPLRLAIREFIARHRLELLSVGFEACEAPAAFVRKALNVLEYGARHKNANSPVAVPHWKMHASRGLVSGSINVIQRH
jgi:hypothetical protein